MNAYCPDCETELDQNTGICPACRWDPLAATAQQQPVESNVPEMSLTERYRGTEFDIRAHYVANQGATVSRGRTFVLVGLLTAAGLYALALGITGML